MNIKQRIKPHYKFVILAKMIVKKSSKSKNNLNKEYLKHFSSEGIIIKDKN